MGTLPKSANLISPYPLMHSGQLNLSFLFENGDFFQGQLHPSNDTKEPFHLRTLEKTLQGTEKRMLYKDEPLFLVLEMAPKSRFIYEGISLKK